MGLVPLVGRIASRGAFIRQLFTAACLLMGGGCVPTLLVVCPEASQHWSLQAVFVVQSLSHV